MTIQDIPQYAELICLPPEPEDWDDADAAFCGSCGFAWDDCFCNRRHEAVDEREGDSPAENRLNRSPHPIRMTERTTP